MTTTPTSVATETDNVTRLPDGSAFAITSFPLPDSHWLYAPREYAEGADVPKELPRPILSHTEHREAVVAAIRYAVRGATMCGKEPDFDPDALVQNAVYALCGPFGGRTTLAEKITLATGQATTAQCFDAADMATAAAQGFRDGVASVSAGSEPVTNNRPSLEEVFRGLSDRAYCNYIEQMRRDACLGWEHKASHGKFGEAELKGHTIAGEMLGRHKAFAEAANALLDPMAVDADRKQGEKQ